MWPVAKEQQEAPDLCHVQHAQLLHNQVSRAGQTPPQLPTQRGSVSHLKIFLFAVQSDTLYCPWIPHSTSSLSLGSTGTEVPRTRHFLNSDPHLFCGFASFSVLPTGKWGQYLLSLSTGGLWILVFMQHPEDRNSDLIKDLIVKSSLVTRGVLQK